MHGVRKRYEAKTHCNTLQHTAEHRNTLQHTATHCNTLQHTGNNSAALQRFAPQGPRTFAAPPRLNLFKQQPYNYCIY